MRGSHLATALLWSVVAPLLVLALHDDFGTTFDEGVQSEYGELAFDYYASGGRDTAVDSLYNLRHYGPLVETAMAGVRRVTGSPRYPTRHLMLGLIAVVALPAVSGFSKNWRLPPASLFAVLGLMVLPRFAGHAFNNSKDLPFAVALAVFMAAGTAMFVGGKSSWWRTAGVGAAMGLTMAIRPGGAPLLLLYLAGMVLIDRLIMRSRAAARPVRIAVAIAIGVSIMWAAWPAAHSSPVRAPLEAVVTSSSFPHPIPVLFEGRYVSSTEMPWYYLPKMLLITMPLPVLALCGLGIGVALRTLLVDSEESGRRGTSAVALMWLLVPLLVVVFTRPAMYDGIRHFLFILPAVSALCGLGAAVIWSWIAKRHHQALAWVVVTLVVLAPLPALAALHPYQATYYNLLVGGVGGADERYDTDYWLSSFDEAIGWINHEARRQASSDSVVVLVTSMPVPEAAALEGGPECWTDTTVSMDPSVSRHFIQEPLRSRAANDVHVVTWPDIWEGEVSWAHVDYYLATTRFRYDECFADRPVVHSIGRQGATFAVVRALKSGS